MQIQFQALNPKSKHFSNLENIILKFTKSLHVVVRLYHVKSKVNPYTRNTAVQMISKVNTIEEYQKPKMIIKSQTHLETSESRFISNHVLKSTNTP